MFKATYLSLYKKKAENGTTSTVFRYGLKGSPADVQRYKEGIEARGYEMAIDEKTGQPIFFTTVYRGASCNVIITDTGKVVVNDNQFDQMQSQLQLATDPSLKQALAGAIAQKMVENIYGSSHAAAAIAAAPVAAQAPVGEEELVDPGKDADLAE